MILESDVRLMLVHHIKFAHEAMFLYRDADKGITLEKHTNVKEHGKTGRSISSYYIDNDEREFKSLEELVDAYNEKFRLLEDSPSEEVKYFRVVVKREAKQ